MFKTFPQFTKLTLAHKDEYEDFIRNFPPVSEISFTTAMTWWSMFQPISVSWLNGNLVVAHFILGDEKNTGLSLIGVNDIDSSICTIFDYLKERDEPARMVHVSEFVVHAIAYPELFKFTGERDYDEYITPVSAMHPLSQASAASQRKITIFRKGLHGAKASLNSIDLSKKTNREILYEHALGWWQQESQLNRPPRLYIDSLQMVLANAVFLDVDNICLFTDNNLRGFYLHQLTHDKTYATVNYYAFDSIKHGVPEYLLYASFKELHRQGVGFVNLDFDLGTPFFRTSQLKSSPTNYFRKYTIEPA